MGASRTFWQNFYIWTRDLHLYCGLFISPFLLVFAVSTVLLNHAWKPGERVETRTAPIQIEEGLEDFAQERQILELGVTGEANFVRGFATREVVTIPVRKPGERTIVRIDVKNRRADVERRVAGFWDATIFLHVLPGPHKRPNWFFTKVWGWVADSTVYVVIFLSTSGIYLWAVLRAERRAGLISLGLGSVSFILVMYRLVAAETCRQFHGVAEPQPKNSPRRTRRIFKIVFSVSSVPSVVKTFLPQSQEFAD